MLVFGAAMGLAGSTAAEHRLVIDHAALQQELTDLRRRARELDEKIRRLEAELAQDAPPRAARSLGGTRPSDCGMLPFYRDSAGIKHLRAECLDPADELSCDPPYALDQRGLRRMRPECLSGDAPIRRSED